MLYHVSPSFITVVFIGGVDTTVNAAVGAVITGARAEALAQRDEGQRIGVIGREDHAQVDGTCQQHDQPGAQGRIMSQREQLVHRAAVISCQSSVFSFRTRSGINIRDRVLLKTDH